MNRRVVITGLGVLAPNGNSVSEYWKALLAGQSGINQITYFDTTDFPVQIAGELKGFDPMDHFDRREARKLDPFSIFALVAAKEALQQAGLDKDDHNPDRIGVMLGSGVGGIQTLEQQHRILIKRGPRRISPYFVPMMIINIAAGQVAMHWNFRGPNQTVSSACASATDAIGIAFRMIQAGTADVMVAGGTEACIAPLPIAGFANMKALSTRNEDPQGASRPFDKDRDGFVMGEGAGVLILESQAHALQRGAVIMAEVAGYGATNDAFHITQPAPGGAGAVKAMQAAIQDANLDPQDIQYINAHGTSTPYNDKNETMAIKEVFGQHAYNLKVSSTKSMTGHLLGASGAVEAIASVMAIKEDMVPPTINYTTPDSECNLDYVPNEAQPLSVEAALSNTFGFGGHNAVICIRRWIE